MSVSFVDSANQPVPATEVTLVVATGASPALMVQCHEDGGVALDAGSADGGSALQVPASCSGNTYILSTLDINPGEGTLQVEATSGRGQFAGAVTAARRDEVRVVGPGCSCTHRNYAATVTLSQ